MFSNPNNIYKPLLCILLFPLILYQKPVYGSEDRGHILATVGKKEISKDIFMTEMNRRRGKFNGYEQKKALLDELVNKEILLSAAKKAGYEKDPQIIAALERFMINKYRKDFLKPKLDKITASEEDITNYYINHKKEFTISAKVRAAVIYIAVPKRVSNSKMSELKDKAWKAKKETSALSKETGSFGSVAVKYSDDMATRYKGGDTGWINEESKNLRWNEKVLKSIFELKHKGDISRIITTDTGFYIVKLMDREPERLRNMDELRNGIRYLVLKEKKTKAEDLFMEGLKGKLNVAINSMLLHSIKPPDDEYKDKILPPTLPGN